MLAQPVDPRHRPDRTARPRILEPGLAVLTGETGAGKSILLDAFALALGGRGDAGWCASGAAHGQVTRGVRCCQTAIRPSRCSPSNGLMTAASTQDRRTDPAPRAARRRRPHPRLRQRPAGRRAGPASAVGATLVEIHGQHDERALVDAADPSRGLLDAFGRTRRRRSARWTTAVRRLRAARRSASAHREAHGARRARGRLSAPRLGRASQARRREIGEEDGAGRAAHRHDAGREDRRRSARSARGCRRASSRRSPRSAAAMRRLERRAGNAAELIEPAVKALDAAINALRRTPTSICQPALSAADFDPTGTGTDRGAAVCAARRGAQTRDPGRSISRRSPSATPTSWR
ncbi:MAG: AAA family ATPase [Rhodopseudomonas palustris]|nr:AAA family ATPase [Rhodopseudomonas palustris]